jgi:hypothetical protein
MDYYEAQGLMDYFNMLNGKTREEMSLEPFTVTKIRSSIMGIPVFIS